MKPGEILPAKGELELNAARNRNPITIEVPNTDDRPIQGGSHYHFCETNDALQVERKRTKGKRHDMPPGTALSLDSLGMGKSAIGRTAGRIAAIGKAGNPDVQPGVDIIIGPGTEAIAG